MKKYFVFVFLPSIIVITLLIIFKNYTPLTHAPSDPDFITSDILKNSNITDNLSNTSQNSNQQQTIFKAQTTGQKKKKAEDFRPIVMEVQQKDKIARVKSGKINNEIQSSVNTNDTVMIYSDDGSTVYEVKVINK